MLKYFSKREKGSCIAREEVVMEIEKLHTELIRETGIRAQVIQELRELAKKYQLDKVLLCLCGRNDSR